MILSTILFASIWTSDTVVKISQFVNDHYTAILTLIVAAIAAGLIVPKSWERWSERYVQSHQRLLWIVVVFLFTLIPITFYLILTR
jgi:hypothetical protein